jgi:hypothetical protein
MALEILDGAFVFLRGSLAVERAKVFSFARSRILFARIQPILPGFQFPNHDSTRRRRNGHANPALVVA